MSGLALATASPQETAAVASVLAEALAGGDVLLLTGPIGAGKTAFTQGLARALGVTEPVVSPSFLLHLVYEGRLTLNHFDLYRLTSRAEVGELAIEEAADGDAVAVIEWGDRFPDPVAPPYLTIGFALGEADDDRVLTLTPGGGDWAARLDALAPGLRAAAAEAGA